jgi:type IV secretory pathway TraG/TraD family ATPase VirD4
MSKSRVTAQPRPATNDIFPELGFNIDQATINQALILGGIIGTVLLLQLFMPKRSAKIATARWATKREIDAANKVGLQSALRKSVTNPTLWISEPIGESYPTLDDLPKAKGVTYFNKANQSIIILGTSGSGKTRTVLDPMVKSALDQGFSVMLVDAKHRNQAAHIVPYAKNCEYNIAVFAPGESFPESDTFNFFDSFRNVRDPSVYAVQICATINKNTKESGAKSDPFFDENGAKIAAGAMVLAQHIADTLNRPDLANMLFAYSILDLPDLPQRIEAAKTTLPLAVCTLFKSLMSTGDDKGKNKTQGSLLATAEQILSRFALPALIPSCCQQGTFPNFDLKEPLKLEGKKLCIFGLDQDTDSVVAPIIAAAIEQIASYNLNNTRPRKTPLVIFLDEFAAFKMPFIKKIQAEKRSMGAVVVICQQVPSQFDDNYGSGAAKGFMARASTHIILNPGDWEAAEAISKSLGEEEIRISSRGSSHSRGKNPSSSTSSNEQVQKRRLISAEDILQMAEGDCIIRTPIVRSIGAPFANEKQKIPYRKRFRVNNEAVDVEEAQAEKLYSRMCKAVAEAKSDQQLDEKAIRRIVNEHYEILEKFIPKPKPKTSKPEEAAPSSKRCVMLSQVTTKMRYEGFAIPGDLPDRKIEIPNNFSDNLTLEECQQLLNTEGIKHHEFAHF